MVTEDELQDAIREYFRRTGESIPDVDIRELRALPTSHGQYDGTLFLSYLGLGHGDALRAALAILRVGFKTRAILDGRLRDVTLEEEQVFPEERQRTVLAAYLAFTL